jgi:muconolactone delta-isomerase
MSYPNDQMDLIVAGGDEQRHRTVMSVYHRRWWRVGGIRNWSTFNLDRVMELHLAKRAAVH